MIYAHCLDMYQAAILVLRRRGADQILLNTPIHKAQAVSSFCQSRQLTLSSFGRPAQVLSSVLYK